MTTHPREFSLEEANALIPKLLVHLKDLQEKKAAYLKQHDYLFMSELIVEAEKKSGRQAGSTEIVEQAQGFEESMACFEKDIEVIRETGCIVRNLEKGWIDFLGRYQGELVYFSWRSEEEKISFYHQLDESFEERRPLVDEGDKN